jgi:hypothetical protein
MERTPKALWNETSGWDAWDAAPRDGPAVFVVDAAAFDRGDVVGTWIDPYDDARNVEQKLSELLGRDAEQGTWAIVDQTGLGRLMMGEAPSIEELRDEAASTFPDWCVAQAGNT